MKTYRSLMGRARREAVARMLARVMTSCRRTILPAPAITTAMGKTKVSINRLWTVRKNRHGRSNIRVAMRLDPKTLAFADMKSVARRIFHFIWAIPRAVCMRQSQCLERCWKHAGLEKADR